MNKIVDDAFVEMPFTNNGKTICFETNRFSKFKFDISEKIDELYIEMLVICVRIFLVGFIIGAVLGGILIYKLMM